MLIVDDCTDEGRFEPTTIQLTCGDGTAVAGNLTWSEWNCGIAVGQGTVNEVSCVPDCADGKDLVYNAKFTLSEPVQAESGKDTSPVSPYPTSEKGPTRRHSAVQGVLRHPACSVHSCMPGRRTRRKLGTVWLDGIAKDPHRLFRDRGQESDKWERTGTT